MSSSQPFDIYSALLGQRVVFLRGPLDDDAVGRLSAQLLLLARTEPARSIELYIDSSDGSLAAALSLSDVIQSVAASVSTTCIGAAAGPAALVLASGARGKRFALPHARISLKQPPEEIAPGHPTEVEQRARQVARIRAQAVERLAQRTGQPPRRIERDLAQGDWLDVAQAREYGLIDALAARSANT